MTWSLSQHSDVEYFRTQQPSRPLGLGLGLMLELEFLTGSFGVVTAVCQPPTSSKQKQQRMAEIVAVQIEFVGRLGNRFYGIRLFRETRIEPICIYACRQPARALA